MRPLADKLNFCMLSCQSGNYELIGKAHQILRSASDRNNRIQTTEAENKAKNQIKKEPEKQDSVCSPWKESKSVYNGSIQSCTHRRTIHICHAVNQPRLPSKGKWMKKMCGVYTQWSIIYPSWRMQSWCRKNEC